MPPRHAYWTIIVDDQPTSFRAHDLEELLPTFNRLRDKHPNAQLRWFERGQLWESRDAAREQGLGRGERRWQGPRPSREGEPQETPPPRDRKWRPGGEHRDPRQKYTDAKKAKWDRYKQNIRDRWEEKQRERPVPDEGEFTPPHGDPMRPKVGDRRRFDRGSRPDFDDHRDDGSPSRPHGDPMRRDRGWKPKPPGDRGWKPKPPGDRGWKPKPPGDRGWKPKPSGGGWRRESDRRPDRSHEGQGAPRREFQRDDDPTRARTSKPAGEGKKGGFGKRSGGFGKKPGSFGNKSGGFAKKSTFGRKPFRSGPPRGPRGPRKRRDDEE
jgi:hypothetical protein